MKSHRGVQAEFHPLARSESRIPVELRSFLSRAYVFKTIADYDLGSNVGTSEADARIAIETAARFVDCVAQVMGGRKAGA